MSHLVYPKEKVHAWFELEGHSITHPVVVSVDTMRLILGKPHVANYNLTRDWKRLCSRAGVPSVLWLTQELRKSLVENNRKDASGVVRDYVEELQALNYSKKTNKNKSGHCLMTLNEFKKCLCVLKSKAGDLFREYLVQAQNAYYKNKAVIPKEDKQPVKAALDTYMCSGASDYECRKEERDSEEAAVRDKLAKELCGEIEVSTSMGRVDVLTDDEIIEVKRASYWKHALGQVLAYSMGTGMTKKRKRVHLFGGHEKDLFDAVRVCSKYDVRVTHEAHKKSRVCA